MANRNGLTIIDGSTRYPFAIVKEATKESRGLQIISKPWEQGDPKQYWKMPLHSWDGGLDSDRLFNKRKYSKANADLSYKGLLLPPPLINSLTLPTAAVSAIPTLRNIPVALTEGVDSVTITKPSGTVDGDVMIALINSDAAVATLSGWTLILTSKGYIFRKVASSEGSNYTFVASGASITTGVILTLVGVDTTTPIETSATSSDSTTPYTAPTITTTTNGCVILAGVFISNATLFTPPAGFIEIFDGLVTNQAATAAYIYKQTAGATGTYDFIGTNTATGGTFTLALKPASAAPNVTANFTKPPIYFNSKHWVFSGRYLYSIDSSYIIVCERDFSSLLPITDLCVFNNELIIAKGYGDANNVYYNNMWKLTTTGLYTESTSLAKAQLLCVIGKNLWRSRNSASGTTLSVSSCLTTPLTETNWGTAYIVTSTSTVINSLTNYGGVIWVGTPDGMYSPDINTVFYNQTPQLLQWPHADNCVGVFVAKGYLWCPSVAGLLRITNGESVIRGPEKSNRLSYQWLVRGGFEWLGVIYLICNDQSTTADSVIIKMLEDEQNINENSEYIYHEWLRLGATTIGYMIGILINQTNPSLIYGLTNSLKYIKLGRGGREIDDSNYSYGLAWELETGLIKPTEDLSLVTGLIGTIIVTDQDASETITTIQYKLEEGSYVDMLDDQESGAGVMPITNTSGYAAVTRYASKTSNQAQFFGFKLAGTLSDAHSGTDRPEIREFYAFGYVRPRFIDHIRLSIYAEANAITGLGIRSGRSAGYTSAQFKRWLRDQTTLTFELPDYEESRTTRGRVVEVEDEEMFIEKGTDGIDTEVKRLFITIARDDFAGVIYNA